MYESKSKQHPDEILLDTYLDGELSPSEHRGIEDHLQECRYCRKYVDKRRAFFALISASEEVLLPYDLSSNVLNTLQRGRLRLLAGVLSLEAVLAIVLLLFSESPISSDLLNRFGPTRFMDAFLWLSDRFIWLGEQVESGFLVIKEATELVPLPGATLLPALQLNWLHWTGILGGLVFLWLLSNRVLIGKSELYRSRTS
jgi:hypothetical protein